MAKRPAILFYTGDWLKDTALRTCSIGARGMWIDMLCYMHDCEPYGHLKVNHKVIHISNLAAMVGLTINVADGYLKELLDAGVCQQLPDGTIYSARMVKDEDVRRKRATGGSLGGNPTLKKNKKNLLKDNSEVNKKDNLKGYPSLENVNVIVNEDENTIQEEGGTGEETTGNHTDPGSDSVAVNHGYPAVHLQAMYTKEDCLTHYFSGACSQQLELHLMNRPQLTAGGFDKGVGELRRWGEAFNLHLINKGDDNKRLIDWCTHFFNWTKTQDLTADPKNIFKNANSNRNTAKPAGNNGANYARGGASVTDLQSLKRGRDAGDDERAEFADYQVVK